MKIATWNVNSLRVRLPQVLSWLESATPDILALQETKCPDEEFCLAELNKAGYEVAYTGQRTYNGVAILSREKPTEILTDLPGIEDPQRRILAVTVGQYRIINLYVPNGESIISDKYRYKLSWLENITHFLKEESARYPNIVVLGDFNIAPHNVDVHNPQTWIGRILFSEPERAAFQTILNAGFDDCFRLFEQPEKSFTWWDYRMNAFKRNMGLRIDHILASKSLSPYCRECIIDKTPRGLERPSDHTPVMAEFVLP